PASSRSGTWCSSSTTATRRGSSPSCRRSTSTPGWASSASPRCCRACPPTTIATSCAASSLARRSSRASTTDGRAVTFLIADGVLPSNDGRGYVLRRLLRRAARHGKLLGLSRPFLHEVVGTVVDTMGRAYPEVVEHQRRTMEVVREEEERFAATLDRGLALLESEVAQVRQAGERTLAGEVAFRLYDTYGFPLDLTEDILAAEGLTVDR